MREDFFLADTKKDKLISWDSLIQDINNTSTYNVFCKTPDYYSIFKHIILSLVIRENIILLDSDFTNSELETFLGFSRLNEYKRTIENKEFLPVQDKEDLLKRIRNVDDDWEITLFTSGTTGIPKKISHNIKTISRFVKTSDSNKYNIWGFAYNPTHMAGIQVFFQALLNGNFLVRLFGLKPSEIYDQIQKYEISHISATPTFYKLMLPCENVFNSVLKITSGGEKFNDQIIKKLSTIFPKARTTNVYASTEAGSLFASENNIFTINSSHTNLIKVLDDELLIHNSLMGKSNLEVGEWYHTGDIVHVVSQEPLKFKFISRKSDMINVGGYNVNPLEIEEAILSIDSVENAIVFSKSNSVLGSIIMSEVVCDSDKIKEAEIRSYLKTKLQDFKIPRIVKFVKELSTTRTGKIKRK